MPTRTIKIEISKQDNGRFQLTVNGELSNVSINEFNLDEWARLSDQFIIAYPGKSECSGHGYNWCPSTHRHDLLDWHGNKIGTYRIMSTWRTPRSYVCSSMSSIECFVNGVRYVGRGPGEGMALRAKKSSNQRITK